MSSVTNNTSIEIQHDRRKSSYWSKQPMHVFNNSDSKKIAPIVDKPSERYVEYLPPGFKFKTLNLNHLNEIYGLLCDHYVEDEQHLIRLNYSKEFLYWYLKYVPTGFIVGLIYTNEKTQTIKLVGLITAIFIDMIIYENKLKMPYVNLLCVQSKLRKLNLGIALINELKNRIYETGINYGFFTTIEKLQSAFSMTNEYVIPINYKKLKSIDFLTEDLPELPIPEVNPLHLLKESDIPIVVPELNKFMEKFDVRMYFTNDCAKFFLLAKKNTVYSFVNKDESNNILDFVTVYKNVYYCIERRVNISVAQLAFYYYKSMTLTELIINLLDKLRNYGFDQLIMRNFADNESINITKFSTYGDLNYYFYNINMKSTYSSKILLFPI